MEEPSTITPTLPAETPGSKTETWHIHRFVIFLIVGMVALVLAPDYVRAGIWRQIVAHKVLTAFFVFFLVLALSVIWQLGSKLDDLVFLFLNVKGSRTKLSDTLMEVFTQIGNGVFAVLLAGAFYLSGQRTFAFQFVLGTFTLWLTVEAIKLLIGRKRPFYVLTTARIVGNKAMGYSFPSGHTSQAFYLATILSQNFELPWYGVLGLYLLAVLTGITRIYLGAHYPKDVIAGAFLGTVWGYFAGVLYGLVQTWVGW